jgi:serine carboxypeptidase-like clade 2
MVGGYVQQYEGDFTFASVRGAGHTAPTFQPKRALVLLYSFLKGILPPADIPK